MCVLTGTLCLSASVTQIPFEEFAQRRSKEELQEIIQELHDGKRPPDFTSSDGTPVIFNSDQLQYIPIEAETMVK